MSIVLLDLLKGIFGGNFPTLVSRFLGKSESSTKSAVSSMIPALLGAIMRKVSPLQGDTSLACAIGASVLLALARSDAAGDALTSAIPISSDCSTPTFTVKVYRS